MATTARQQYFADESSLQKDSREFSIANDIQQKIDSVETGAQVNVIETVKVNGTALTPDSNKAVDIDVPDVIDNLYTVNSDDALSAKQGKILYDYIQNLQSVGRFLSNWDCATGLPVTNPSESPYVYHAGDYYMVSNVATSPATNYKPNGSSYTTGVASVTVETGNVGISDRYMYDGTNWVLLSAGASIAIDSSLSTTSTNPVENRVITNTLNSKQDALTAGDNISISNNTISADVNVKSFYLTGETGQTNLDTAQEAYEWQDAGNEAIIIYGPDRGIAGLSASGNTGEYRYLYDSGSGLVFVATTPVEQSSSQGVGGRSLNKALLTLTVSGGQVTAITKANSVVVADFLSTSQTNHPFSPTNNYDPATKKYVDDSISGITIPTVNDTTISFTQNGASVGDITLNQSSAETIALIDTTYTAGTGIAILNINKNARQGPAPDGFHVPALTEWQGLNMIIGSIFSDAGIMNTGNNWKINLHMPFAGRRDASSAGISLQGTGGCYWTSSPYGATDAHNFYLNSGSVYLTYGDYRASAISIRAFKDIFEAPTSSWTVILGTLGSAGIFRDQTNGLISITSDGTTGYTIMDKNLGATAVYNDGDALSEANCGTYFQRGNNYGFAWTGNITTSTQKVDASAYGPGNYYNSSTFIRATGDWSSVQNDDLWGDTTGTIVINNAITNTGVTSVNGQTGDITIQTGGNYSAGTGINISNQNVISADTTVVATQTDLASKQGTLTASTGINIDSSNNISNTLPGPTIAATAPTGTEGALWYDTTNDVLMAYNGTAWKEAGTQMKVLSYGHSTWQDFIDAYNENAIVYCRASSNSNPGSGTQGRMAFMAFVSINSGTGLPTSVEFQYYRSRSDHNTQANQLDQVFVYTLTSASGGTWSVTERNTGAKAVAGTGINLAFGSGNMTISADTTVLATQTDLSSKQDTLVSGTNIKTINNQSLLGSGNITTPDTTYNAGTGIEIRNGNDYSALKGPAPDGFHVPLLTEWQGLKTIMDGLSLTTGDGWRINLHMPFAGNRRIDDASLYSQGTSGIYWSSYSSSINGYYLFINSSSVNAIYGNRCALGYSLRCFKDSYITPDSTWTVVQGTLGSAGIFWNQTEGLISITDGTTGYTIMDKNLGATTVYNNGDTLTQANMGNMYQWGNNYGFPSTGTISNTSPTQVDASAYGPNTENGYYSSDTFIIRNDNWSSVVNEDLWGGVTGVVTLNNAITNTGVLSVNGQTGDVIVNDVKKSATAPSSPTEGMIWYDTTNDILKTYNGTSWDEAGGGGDVRVFAVPAVNDDISDMVTRLSAGKGVILHEMVSGTDAFYKVDYHDDVTQEITASLLYSYNGGYARYYTIVYNYSTKKVSTKTSSLTYFFAPETAGTQGQILTKTNSGYEWANASGGLQVAPNSPITGIKYVWYGTEADYANLSQYYTDTPGDTEFRCF